VTGGLSFATIRTMAGAVCAIAMPPILEFGARCPDVTFDLLIADVVIPGMNGHDSHREIVLDRPARARCSSRDTPTTSWDTTVSSPKRWTSSRSPSPPRV
jgi:hypothetical protein